MSKAKKVPAAPALKVSKSRFFTWSIKKMYLLLVLGVVVIYGNTIVNDYSLDDSIDIYENANVAKGIAGIPDIFTSPFVVTEYYKFDYRPISPATFAVEKEIFGFNPHISHAINILLYMACVLLLFTLLLKITAGKTPKIIFVVTVLFLVHPLHTEVVASLKNRQELLSFIFGFLSLNLMYDFLSGVELRWTKMFASLLFFVLALFSKLASLPFLFFLFYFIFTIPSGLNKYRKSAVSLLLLSAPMLFIFFTREWLFRPYFFDENPLVLYSSLSYKVGTTLHVFLVYLKMLFLPYPMSFYYGYDTVKVLPVYHPVAILCLLLLITMFGFSARNCIHKKPSGIFGLFFIASIMMYNNITFTYPGLLSDRAMFLPSAWFIAFIVFIYRENFPSGRIKAYVNKYAGTAFVLLVVLVSSVYVIKRNTQWKTQLSIMEADIGHLQNSTLATYYYAWTLDSELRKKDNLTDREQLLKTSKEYYLRSISLGLRMAEPYYRLAMLSKYFDNDLDSSVFYLKKYISQDTIHARGFYELADSYFKQGKFAESEPYYRKVYQLKPTDTLNLFYYVQVVYMTGQVDEALKLNEELIKIAPQTQYPYLNSGSILKVMGDEKKAFSSLENAVEFGCRNPGLIRDMIEYYKRQNDNDRAVKYQKILDAL